MKGSLILFVEVVVFFHLPAKGASGEPGVASNKARHPAPENGAA